MKVEYIDHYGTDLSVVNAAKVSFSKYSTEIGKNEISLLYFLARGVRSREFNEIIEELVGSTNPAEVEHIVDSLRKKAVHWTPFTHNGITLRCSAPVPIRTQCFKHKVGFTENEESRRYISSTPELYIPDVWRKSAKDVKQGSSSDEVKTMIINDEETTVTNAYKDICSSAIELYEEMILQGICPEQARFVLPQGVIVNWIWTGNLASFARYFIQRTDSHAQLESLLLAEDIGQIMSNLFPYSWEALTGVRND